MLPSATSWNQPEFPNFIQSSVQTGLIPSPTVSCAIPPGISWRRSALNIPLQIGSEYTFDDINGARKEEFLGKVGKELGENVKSYGVNVQQFGLIGSLRPPKALLDAVNSKTQAIQKSIQVENEVRQAEAEAKKKIAIANGEAAANRALASSLDPKLLEWEKLQIMRQQIAKWDGKMPGVMGSSNMLLNLPATK